MSIRLFLEGFSIWIGTLGFLGSSVVKNLPAMQETCRGDSFSIPGSGRSPGEGNGNPLPWTEEPGGLQSMGWPKSWTWFSNSTTTTDCGSRFPSLMWWVFCNPLRAWIEQKSGGRESYFFLLDWVGGIQVFSCLWTDSDSSALKVSYKWHIQFFRSSGLWIGKGATTPACLGLQFADSRLWEFSTSNIMRANFLK